MEEGKLSLEKEAVVEKNKTKILGKSDINTGKKPFWSNTFIFVE